VQVLDKRGSGLGGAARSFTQSYADFLTAPRLRIGSPHLANLKISEGCSNFCKFCSIPYIRGVQVSRPVEDIVAEARQLVEAGARELDLIAQDTSSYGRDLYGERTACRRCCAPWPGWRLTCGSASCMPSRVS
jgi:tRNA A37 methylthiotransferase MiaB